MSIKIKDNYTYTMISWFFLKFIIVILILVDSFIIYFQNILFFFSLLFELKNKKFPCATAAQGVVEEQEAGHEELSCRGYTQCPSVLG